MTSPEPLFRRDFYLVVACNFLQGLGFASMLTLPLYLDHLHASRAEIGLVMASASIGGLLARPLIGWSLDVHGRKSTLTVGTVILLLGMCSLYFVTSIGPLVYASRVLIGVGIGTLFSGYLALAADIVPYHRRTEGIALFGVSGLLAMMVNPLVGELELDTSDLRLIFPAMGIPIVLSLLTLWPIREERSSPDGHAKLSLEAVLTSFRKDTVWPVWFATVVFSSLVAIFAAFGTVAAEHKGVAKPAMMWATYSLGAISVRLFGGRVPDAVGPEKLVPPALITYAVAAFIIASAETSRGFLWAGGLAGMAHGYCFPVLTSQLVSRISDRQRGSALAMFTAIWELTTLLGAPSFGWLADRFGDELMFRVGAGFAVGSVLIWLPLERRAQRSISA